MFRKLAVVLVAPLLVATACAKESDDGAVEVKTGAAAVSALQAAPDAAADAGTAAFEMVMAMTLEGEAFEIVASGAFDDAAQRMHMTMDMGSLFEELAASSGESVPEGFGGDWEFVAADGTFYMRAPLFDMLLGTSGWISMTPEDLGGAAGGMGVGAGAYDPSKLLESLRGVGGEPEVVGEEDVRGVATTHYRAVMDLAQALEEVPEEEREAVEAQLEQLGEIGDTDIPVDIWIDADDLPRRMEMDMGSLLSSLGAGEGSMTMSMEFFDYGEPVDVEVPSPDEVTPFAEVMGAGVEGFGGGAVIERTVEIDGHGGRLSLALAEAGEGGRPLLLVHGFTGAKEDFTDFLDPLADLGWHAVAPDQRGHGASSQPDDEASYTFDAFATDLLGLLDALGWDRCVALGHSMGGMVVQTAILEAPARFDGLVLMDTSHKGLRADPELVELGVAIARAEGIAAVMAAQDALGPDQPLGTGPHQRLLETREGYKDFGARKMLASSASMYAAMLQTITAAEAIDRLSDLGAIAVPTLVLVGEEDAPFRKPSQRMADAIPGAELVVLPDGGHSPQFESPDLWWKALSDFLARL